MPIFLSKHQKLILQCYPPGKGIEKNPNSSELSYLLYYASTRRVKLEKVIKFLNKKTIGDSNRNRFGNLQVTLIIVSSLIEKCSDNLNVFAPEVLSILGLSIKNDDLGLAKVLLNTFGTLCKNLNADLFVGDKQFVDNFSKLSKRIFDFGISNSIHSKPNKLEWTMLSLISCKYVSYCLGFNSKLSSSFLSDSMPILIESYYANKSGNRELSSPKEGDNRLSKVTSAKTAAAQQKVEEDFENDIVDKSDLHEESISALKSCFNTSLTSQISEAVMQVVKFGFTKGNSFGDNWLGEFLQLCTSWVPVQLRFIVLGTLVGNLTQLSKNKTQTPYQKHVASSILGLVASNVNLIGLSISDVMQSILDLKDRLYFEQVTYLSTEDKQQLSDIYSNIVVKLSTHIYYFDQVPDSVNEIFIKIDSTLQDHSEKSENPNIGDESLFEFISSLLGDIQGIFQALKPDSNTINRNYVDIKHWEISLPLIAQKKLTNLYNGLSTSQVEQIQIKYVRLFRVFLDNELDHEITSDTEENGTNANSSTNGTHAANLSANGSHTGNGSYATSTTSLNGVQIEKDSGLTPDYYHLISNQPNFMSHYLVYLDKYLTNNEHMNLEVLEDLLDISKSLIDHFGLNFFHNFVPFYFHWSMDSEVKNSSDKNEKLKDTFTQSILQYILNHLDTQYQSELASYCSTSKLNIKVNENISYKVHNNLWADELVRIQNELKSPTELPIISKQDLQTFVHGNKFLSTWIVSDKPLILSNVVDDGISKELDNENENNDEFLSVNGHSNGHSNGNGISNGNGYSNGQSLNGNTPDSSSTDGEIKQGLGLGNTADIASIQSGLRNISGTHNLAGVNLNNTNANTSFNTTNSYSWTEYNGSISTNQNSKHFKVSDLKEVLNDFNVKKDEGHPGSILSKQMASQDVESILDDLDDDSFIV